MTGTFPLNHIVFTYLGLTLSNSLPVYKSKIMAVFFSLHLVTTANLVTFRSINRFMFTSVVQEAGGE